ncbi:MAG: hypothetical protein AAF570_01375, partial [Bacteroidota bacterium]
MEKSNMAPQMGQREGMPESEGMRSFSAPAFSLTASDAMPGMGSGSTPDAPVVQRKEVMYRHAADENATDVAAFVTALDAATQAVWRTLISRVPTIGEIALDGHMSHYNTLLHSYCTTGSRSSARRLPAAFGYAVESLVTKLRLPAVGGGLTIDLQVASGNTRPDIVLSKDGTAVAWIDLTASKSEGHITKKSGSGWSTKPHVYEVSYPSITAESLKGLLAASASGEVAGPDDIEIAYWTKRAREEAKMDKILGMLRFNLMIGLDQRKGDMYDTAIRKEVQ